VEPCGGGGGGGSHHQPTDFSGLVEVGPGHHPADLRCPLQRAAILSSLKEM